MVVSEQMRCVSIFGLETEHRSFMCDWKHKIDYYVDMMSKLNFNIFRIPFSYQYVKEGDFRELDHLVDITELYNISVILDFHRVWSNTQQPTPFDYGMTEHQFQETWILLLDRYKNKTSVIGGNSYNEYVPTDTNYLVGYTKRLFEKIEKQFPERYYHFVTGTAWSGNLRGISLEDLPYKDRIYYSIHKYSFSGSGNEEDWETSFGNVGLPLERVIVGEFGWIGTDEKQVDWAKRFIAYLKKKNILNTCYWTLSQSGDTGNLYDNDCDTFHWDNYELLKTLWV